jgi:hypothetical protein
MIGAQHTVFRVHVATGFTMIEVEVTNGDRTFAEVPLPARFPPPIVVTNDFAFELTPVQMISMSPSRVSGGCIACFAFDELFAYQEMKVCGVD